VQDGQRAFEEQRTRLRLVEQELAQEKEATAVITARLAQAAGHTNRLTGLVKERDQQITMQAEALAVSQTQGLSLQHANHTLELAKKEAEERSRAYQQLEENHATEKTKARELESSLEHEQKKLERLQDAVDTSAKELREVLPVLDKKTLLSQSLQQRLREVEGENKCLQQAVEDLTGENSIAQTQLVVLKDLRKDRDQMRKASQGLWLLFNKTIPKLRADLVSVRGTALHDITEMRSTVENGIQKIQHATTDMLVQVKHDTEMEATTKVSEMLQSTEGTHSDILHKLHEKEMGLVQATAERDTLRSQYEGKLVEHERLKENHRILSKRLEHRDSEIHELTREKTGMEEHGKKAMAIAIQQLEIEMKAKEMHQDSVRKLIRDRDQDSKKMADMSELLSERVTNLDQLEEARFKAQIRADSEEAVANMSRQSMQRLESQLGAKLEGMAAARQDAERLMMAVAKERDDVMVKNATLKDSLREARQRFEYLEEETSQMATKMIQTEEAPFVISFACVLATSL